MHSFSFTSTYLFLERLIKEGKGFIDNTPAEIMKQQREARIPSSCRNQCKYTFLYNCTCYMHVVYACSCSLNQKHLDVLLVFEDQYTYKKKLLCS